MEGMKAATREWNHSVEEPELEFDDMGMELAAHDGTRQTQLLINFS